MSGGIPRRKTISHVLRQTPDSSDDAIARLFVARSGGGNNVLRDLKDVCADQL
jgi:hypothetical protein